MFFLQVSQTLDMAASKRRLLRVENDQVQLQVTLNVRIFDSFIGIMCLPLFITEPRLLSTEQIFQLCLTIPQDDFIGIVDLYYLFLQLTVPIDMYNNNRFFIMLAYNNGSCLWYDVRSDAFLL